MTKIAKHTKRPCKAYLQATSNHEKPDRILKLTGNLNAYDQNIKGFNGENGQHIRSHENIFGRVKKGEI